MKLNKVIIWLFVLSFLTSSLFIAESTATKAAVIDSIPNTTRHMKDYDHSFLSVTGFASEGVNDRSDYVGTSFYREVNNEEEFLQAILDAQNGDVKVIEITEDLNMGWRNLNLSSEETEAYHFIKQNQEPVDGSTNPNIISSGVSELEINDTDGLTIFSKEGNTIRHSELILQRDSNDIIIRNLNFDGMWQWDDTGAHKEVGWGFIVVNGATNVWIDHSSFSIAGDGLIDLKNGATNVTISWSDFGLKADENPDPDSDIYQSINYMEDKYNANELDSDSLYYNMRHDGATKEEIMAYTAYHSKAQLNGSGDKDYVDYVYSNGDVVKDANHRIRLTLAYSNYTNIGQRVPMIRQGVGHVYNLYHDNSTHHDVLDSVSAISDHATYTLSRGMNARNGASIAADTSVYNDINEPIITAEIQGMDDKSMNEPWDTLFQDAYNNNLIVNSQITNEHGTYTGSSWDNDGENLFTKGFTWYDKSTIGNWAWSSQIEGIEEMDKDNPPSEPFTFEYHYDEKLPYTYHILPLDSVESTVNEFSGSGQVDMRAEDWLKTEYSPTISNLIEDIERYGEAEEITNADTKHRLILHLTAVKQFEKQEKNSKVVKHMESFKLLLDHEKKADHISDSVYQDLYQSTEAIISDW